MVKGHARGDKRESDGARQWGAMAGRCAQKNSAAVERGHSPGMKHLFATLCALVVLAGGAEAMAQSRRSPCDELSSLPANAPEPAGLLDRAVTYVSTHTDSTCAVRVLARLLNAGRVGEAVEVGRHTQQRAPGETISNCVVAVTNLATFIQTKVQESRGDAIDCTPELPPLVAELVGQCITLDGTSGGVALQQAVVAALIDVSRVCIDRGHLAAPAAVLVTSFGLPPVPELDRLRHTPLLWYLTDSTLISRLSSWLGHDAPVDGSINVLQRRAREFLWRSARCEGADGDARCSLWRDPPDPRASETLPHLLADDSMLIAARALLAADGRLTADDVTNYPEQISDMEFLEGHHLLDLPVVSEAAASMPLAVGAEVPMTDDVVARIRDLRARMQQMRSPMLSLVRLRLGLTETIRGPLQSRCERAASLATVLYDFAHADGTRTLPLARYRAELIDAADTGEESARRCRGSQQIHMLEFFNRVRDTVQSGQGIADVSIDFSN